MAQFKVISCFRKKSKATELVASGSQELDHLLDIFGLFKTVQKLMAIVSILVPKDQMESIISESEDLYLHEMTIWSETQQEIKQAEETRVNG